VYRRLDKTSRIYKELTLDSGEKVTLRVITSEDLDGVLSFINSIVSEKQGASRSTLYTGFDNKVTRKQEAEWLAQTLDAIDQGEVISMVADIDGKIIANGEVTRGRYKDTHRHGHIGLTMISDYRGRGIGRRMIDILVSESRRAGMHTLDTEFLAENETAKRAYEKAGFKQAGIIPRKVFRRGKYLDGLIMAREL
jgi:RimJ/RimL family protein N-acetyltransferase